MLLLGKEFIKHSKFKKEKIITKNKEINSAIIQSLKMHLINHHSIQH